MRSISTKCGESSKKLAFRPANFSRLPGVDRQREMDCKVSALSATNEARTERTEEVGWKDTQAAAVQLQ